MQKPENIACPLDTATFSDKEEAASSSAYSRTDSANVTSRKATSWGEVPRAGPGRPDPVSAQVRLRLFILHFQRRSRMNSSSLRSPTTSQGLLRLFMLRSQGRRIMNYCRSISPSYPIPLSLRTAGRQYQQPAGRQERKRWPN